MGLPISIDIPGCASSKVFQHAFDSLKEIDKQFSPYKKSSELSKYQRGEVAKKDLDEKFKEVMKACRDAEKLTGGYFSAYYSGIFEPSGYVKGWAIEQAGEVIEKNGFDTYCIGAGGDVLAKSDSKKIWNIGIQDPVNKTKILNLLSIHSGAVATSGNYERGLHIINPKTNQQADELLSVTVAGPNIIKADVLATAVFAAGLSGISLVEKLPSYEALVVDKYSSIYMTPGMEQLFSRNPESNQ